MWTKITRPKYERAGQRYATDLTDAEWAVIEPHMPAAKPLGRPRATDLRAVLDGVLYMARTGCQWRMLPKDFPPFTTVQGYFYDWRDNGLFERINFELLLKHVKPPDGKRAPRLGSSTASRSRPPRAADRAVEPVLGRGAAATRGMPPRRSTACPGAGRGPQAAYRDRHHRPDGWRRDPPRRCARPRRRATRYQSHPRPLPLAAPPLRRQRLFRR